MNPFYKTHATVTTLALSLAGAIALESIATAENWPAWRGPEANGISHEKNLPLKWSTTENVRWKAPLPDRGNSTPVVWGNRVFVTQAIEKQGKRLLLCFDRKSGKLLWQSGVDFPERETTHQTNPYCSASPATDGERVVVSFASAGLYCYDFNGKELWHRDLGKQTHIWGNATSPVLYKDLCYLNFGPGERTFLIALDKKTGKTVWQHDEPTDYQTPGDSKNQKSGYVGSWSDPVIRTVNGREEMFMTYPNRACAFDPKTGKELWTCNGLNPLVYTSPLYDEGIVVAMGGFGGMALAVKAGGNGNVTQTHRLWHHPRTKQRIGSGVIHEGHIYILTDPGVAECFDLKTGKTIWEQTLQGPGPTKQNWSSLVLTPEGNLYAVNQGGDAFVFKASPMFELLATNSMKEKTIGSMAVSDGEIFIRTYNNLWCIGGANSGKAN